jgi:hypothetical protein
VPLTVAMLAARKKNRNERFLQKKRKKGKRRETLAVDLVTTLNLEIFHETNSAACCIII